MNNNPKHKKPWPSLNSWSSKETSSIVLAFLLAFLFHLILPSVWDVVKNASWEKEETKPREIEIVLEPLHRENPERFVETNPDIKPPEEAPETSNFAAQNQLAAQEVPNKLRPNDTPTVQGEFEDSSKIVQGDLMPEMPTPLVSESPVEPQEETPEKIAKSDPFIENKEGEGISSPKPEKELEKKLMEQSVELAEKSKVSQKMRPTPKPRPRVRRATSGPLVKNDRGASRIGALGVDAKFSQFGEYSQRMFEAISYQWKLLVSQHDFVTEDYDTLVVISFSIDNLGMVSHVEVISSTSSTLATLLCKDAIESRSPFGIWSEDMVTTLGEMYQIKFTFLYR